MDNIRKGYSRRKFMGAAGVVALGMSCGLSSSPETALSSKKSDDKEPIIDIHQHIHYHARTDEDMIAHQKAMGITKTILLPAGRPVNSASTHDGVSNGLQAQVGGNAESYLFAREHQDEYLFGACAVPDAPDALYELEKYLKLGAVVIGELKFGVECDSKEMQSIYQLAQEYDVPVLMHWQHGMYNYGFERFYKMLEKYPEVNFIGHAQTWWANIDKNHENQSNLYPKGSIVPGGLTDKYLSDYPNMYGDLSAGSGLNALNRDEEHSKYFLEKHQDKLIYGSDCADASGLPTPDCTGAMSIALIKKLMPNEIQQKMFYKNAEKIFRI